jgi:hypothetical protein
LKALADPRRALPMAGVGLALLVVQLDYSSDIRAALVPAAMTIAFVILGPWSWRVGERIPGRNAPGSKAGGRVWSDPIVGSRETWNPLRFCQASIDTH